MVRAFVLNITLCALCLTVVGAGLVGVSCFQDTGRVSSLQTGQWPAESPVVLAQDRDTLLMFAHPHCPCTKASLEELDRVMNKCHRRVAVHVFFLSPSSCPNRWTMTDLWRSASAIPGVKVQADTDGIVSSEFGAETSGCFLLFNPHGDLLFRGGITADCGREGDNAAAERLVAFLTGKASAAAQTPVYGRPLLSEDQKPRDLVSN